MYSDLRNHHSDSGKERYSFDSRIEPVLFFDEYNPMHPFYLGYINGFRGSDFVPAWLTFSG